MANLFQILSNGVNNLKNNAFNKLLNNNQPPIIPAQQYDNNGNIDYDSSLKVQQNTTPLTFAERLMGRNLTMDEQKINPEGKTELVTHSNFKPGLLNDIAAGYQENRNTPISLNNFGENQNKGAAFRIGEGLGSIGRFIDSPLGRGVLTGAAIGLLGGNPAQALAYGGTATALNQGNRMRDRAYRQQLINTMQDSLKNGEGWNDLTPEEQNTQLQSVADQINGMRGYMTDDVYKNIIAAQQMKDNAEWRKAHLEQQKNAQEEAREDRKLQREMQSEQNKFNNYIQGQRVAQGWATLDDRKKAREEARIAKSNADSYGDIQTQLDNFANMFETVNNPYRYRVFGGASEALNTLSNDEANFNAQRTLLFNQIARKLSGEKGVLSDKDIARVEAALPSLSDTLEQKKAKMKAVYALLDIKRGSANQAVNNYVNAIDNNPLGLDL